MARRASHAGSWYSDETKKLDQQLGDWLNQITDYQKPARAIIVPHAGYSYSGNVAAFAYKQINPEGIKRVFVLGPSHHYSLSGCALSTQTTYETPLGNLPLDKKTIQTLHNTGKFSQMKKSADEAEHSIELHLPFIAKVFKGYNISLVPILVGSAAEGESDEYAKLFKPYLDDPENFFVISSDFCHWGNRFSYTWYEPSHGAIHESIEWLDKTAMTCVETQDPYKLRNYHKTYKNTICGRNPILLLMHTILQCSTTFDLSFIKYAQSSKCKIKSDSSVSYASAVLWVKSEEDAKKKEEKTDLVPSVSSTAKNGKRKRIKK
eukprot:TRINITY_DN4813_c0_g1_i1.p1 TRINITY_DN4813_c0_g1~~TRINITY_DN4813_c0_g1_i1.p1  ORF type:complete len:320 (-),score=44.43 TRINITY_DN4813_c0_g1_i1:66-1025(-)